MKANLQFTQRTGLAALTFLFQASTIHAKEEIRDGFFAGYRNNGYNLADHMLSLPSRPGDKMDCLICHWEPEGGGPRNPHGLQVQAAIKDIDQGDTTALGTAIWAIRANDPDGDGFSTFEEVTDYLRATPQYNNSPTFPGLTPANVSQVNKKDLPTSDITFLNEHLVPMTAVDTTPPSILVLSPNGGQTLDANASTTITWSVSDGTGSGVAGVDLYVSLDSGATFSPIAFLTGSAATGGSYTWFPPNRPTNQAIIHIYAIDNAGNSSTDESNAVFTIASPPGGRVKTTLRDFDMPGIQPLEQRIAPLQDPSTCAGCHGGYDSAVEPHHTWQGSMMSMASKDFMFQANLVIANQDAPESGDICLRCHNSRGWLDGRSTPTDGSLMQAEDQIGVSCDLCHRLVDPVYVPLVSPAVDADLLAILQAVPTEQSTGNYVVDPQGTKRGPFTDADAAHPVIVSPFHKSSRLCGTCHDVSNPVFVRPVGAVSGDEYVAANLNEAPTDMSSEVLMPVERTFSEWKYSAFNSTEGLHRPEFAGNKPDGRVGSCQDCHMRDVAGKGADPVQFPGVPTRQDLPLHDMTGANTWVPYVLATESPGDYKAEAVNDGIDRARYMIENALRLQVTDNGAQIRVRLVNRTGHKLPTGYPEGRRMWINVKFRDAASNLIAESGAYDPTTGVLNHADPTLKVYETKPGIGPALATSLNGTREPNDPDYIPEGPSFHFVLNNRIYLDNRIPPEGFTNAAYETFGGAPIGHTYADGQYWDDTWYDIPPGTDRAEVRVYFQSVSKEFIEFLRDENKTNTLGDEVYALWNNHGKAPPDLMAEGSWLHGFVVTDVINTGGAIQVHFASRAGETYSIQYTDSLGPGLVEWLPFQNGGTLTASGGSSMFLDDFTSATSGGPPPEGRRFYRVGH